MYWNSVEAVYWEIENVLENVLEGTGIFIKKMGGHPVTATPIHLFATTCSLLMFQHGAFLVEFLSALWTLENRLN